MFIVTHATILLLKPARITHESAQRATERLGIDLSEIEPRIADRLVRRSFRKSNGFVLTGNRRFEINRGSYELIVPETTEPA
jgi:hypothetical protein